MVISITSIILMVINYMAFKNIEAKLIDSEDNAINQILSQIPTMEYQHGQIYYDGDPIIVSNPNNGKPLLVIDPDKKLSNAKREDVPFIFEKSFFATNIKYSKVLDTTFKYSDMLGNQDKVIDSGFIREILIKGIGVINIWFFAAITPFIIIFSTLSHIFQHLYLVIMIFIFLLLIGLRPSIRSAFRMTMFTTGAPILIYVTLLILLRDILLVNKVSIIIQFWTLFLAGYSLTRR